MRLLICCILMFISASSFGAKQGNSVMLPNIESSFKLADAKGMSAYFSEPIELVFDNSYDVYSKKQAELVIREFFTNNPPKSFTIDHTRQKGDSNYVVATLKTTTKTFRVYLMLKEVNNEMQILHLRIDIQQ